jgi:hypothetical protein
MNCEILTACNSAKEENGLFTINGAFSRITAPSFPCQLHFSVAMRVCFSSEEDGKHSLRLTLCDLDGKSLGPPIDAAFESRSKENEGYSWKAIVVEIPDLRIAVVNDYSLSLEIDGESIANTTLYVSGPA